MYQLRLTHRLRCCTISKYASRAASITGSQVAGPRQNPPPIPTRPLPVRLRKSTAHFKNKRRRTSNGSEDGQVVSLIPLPTTTMAPASHDIHPARMAMLKMADPDPDMTQPILNLVKSTTEANRTSLPFNRLQPGKPSGQYSTRTSTIRLTTGMYTSSSGNASFNTSSESGKEDLVVAEDEAPIDVDRFLRALEPKIEAQPQESEWCSRLRSRPDLRAQNIEPVEAEGPQLSMDMMPDVKEGLIKAGGGNHTVQFEDDAGFHIKDEMMG